MNPKDFQQLALGLAEHGAFPSEFRTAISRAYYAAFNLGFNLLNELDLTIANNHEAHKQVYYHFNNSEDSELIEVATKIDFLRTKRNHADYHLDRNDVENKQNAKAHVYLADRLINTMEKKLNGKNSNKIIKSMKKWRNKTSH